MKIELIEGVLEKLIEIKATPSANLAVIYQDQVLYRSIGNKQTEPVMIKNELDTIYDLASLTKVIATTTAILKLIEEGCFELDTPVKTLLVDFAYDDVTVLNLLNHTSLIEADIPDYRQLNEEAFYQAVFNPRRIEKDQVQVLYSDINYILLGLIIKSIKGSLSDYVNLVVFEPLGMIDSAYGLKQDTQFDRVASYEITSDRGLVRGVVHDGKCFKMGGVSGHAGVFSTVQDLSCFARMILNNGVYKGARVLSERSIETLFSLTTAGLNEKRSVGWIIGDENYPLGRYASTLTLFHTGFSGGSILIDKLNQVGIVLLTNRVHPSRENKLIISMRKEVHEAIYEGLGLNHEE